MAQRVLIVKVGDAANGIVPDHRELEKTCEMIKNAELPFDNFIVVPDHMNFSVIEKDGNKVLSISTPKREHLTRFSGMLSQRIGLKINLQEIEESV